MKKIATCPQCKTKVTVEGELNQKIPIQCKKCGKKGIIVFRKPQTPTTPPPQPQQKKPTLSPQTQKTPIASKPKKPHDKKPSIFSKKTKPTPAIKQPKIQTPPQTNLQPKEKQKPVTQTVKKTQPTEHTHKLFKNKKPKKEKKAEKKKHLKVKKTKEKKLKQKEKPQKRPTEKKKKHLFSKKKTQPKESLIPDKTPDPLPKHPPIEQKKQHLKETTDEQTLVLVEQPESQDPDHILNENGNKKSLQSKNKKPTEKPLDHLDLEELDFYPVNEPFAYIKILRDTLSLDKYYKVIEPQLNQQNKEDLKFIEKKLIKNLNIHLEEIEAEILDNFLLSEIEKIVKSYSLNLDEITKQKFLYYIKRDFIGYGKIDPLMRDPNIEDISCDGSEVPVFLYHRIFNSLKSNVIFSEEEELSAYVVRLAQKCGKHISIAEPMLDATMPDGSRIQMTLSKAVTAKGSTFTIRKFRSDPITPTDLINYNTMSAEMVAYMWMAVENGVNALISGGTASGKTSALNALALFIPRESKIVSIEETREINLPHPNWIPGVSRSGLGEVVNDKMVGEIGLFDLMKAALRQRPEYILVGEIRGREAYVLFQAMATGHTTYSTVHADSPKSLIHRLEGKPINIPRMMLQSLDIILIQASVHLDGKNVRRSRQIVEIIDIDSISKEILTNEVFHWDPVEDKHIYSGKSYILERIRSQYDMSPQGLSDEFRRRVSILEWMKKNNIRIFNDVASLISTYKENPDEIMNQIKNGEEKEMMNTSEEAIVKMESGSSNQNNDGINKGKKKFWKR